MAKLHNTSVTGDINASGRIFANGKAVAPLEHTHALDQITGLNTAIDTKLRNATVATAENSNKLNGKAADQYALKSDLTSLGEQLNQIQYSITKVFKCPRHTSSVYDNNVVKVTLSEAVRSKDNIKIIVEDDTYVMTVTNLTNSLTSKIVVKNKLNVERILSFSTTNPVIYHVSNDTVIFAGVGINDNMVSVTLQSAEPITANDFTLAQREPSLNLNTLSNKKTISIIEMIPYITDKCVPVTGHGYLYTLPKRNPLYNRLDLNIDPNGPGVYVYDFDNEIVIGIRGGNITYYYNTSARTPKVATHNTNSAYIDMTTISDNIAIYGAGVAMYSSSGIPSFANVKMLPASVSFVDEDNTLSFRQALNLLGRGVTINGNTYDMLSNIDLNSTQTFPATTINDQSITIGGSSTITARANGGNADTVGGLSPNSFITTDNLAYGYFSKVAVYNNDNHLIHPDGTEEWIEYQRPESDDGFDHL